MLRKYQIRLPPPCKIVTPKSFNLNLCTHDYVCELHAMQILVSIDTVGASPQIGEILPPCDVFDCFVLSCPVLSLPFFSILRPDRTAGPIFTLYGSNDVFPRKDRPFGG